MVNVYLNDLLQLPEFFIFLPHFRLHFYFFVFDTLGLNKNNTDQNYFAAQTL